MESKKQRAVACQKDGIAFNPLVVESTGRWALTALQTFRRITNMAADRFGVPKHVQSHRLYQRLGIVIERFTSRMVLSRDFTGEVRPVKSSDISSARGEEDVVLDIFADAEDAGVDSALLFAGDAEEVGENNLGGEGGGSGEPV